MVHRTGAIDLKDLERVAIDTTVQEGDRASDGRPADPSCDREAGGAGEARGRDGKRSDLLQVDANGSRRQRVPAHSLAGCVGQRPSSALGIEIVFHREGRFGTRTITITAISENQLHDTVSTVSHVSDNGRAPLKDPSPGLEQAR